MALNPAPGWHLLTFVSDVAQKRSTLFLNGEKWGVAAAAADAPLTSFGCNAFAPSELKTCPSAGEYHAAIGALSTVHVHPRALDPAEVKQAFRGSSKPLEVGGSVLINMKLNSIKLPIL